MKISYTEMIKLYNLKNYEIIKKSDGEFQCESSVLKNILSQIDVELAVH